MPEIKEDNKDNICLVYGWINTCLQQLSFCKEEKSIIKAKYHLVKAQEALEPIYLKI